MGAALVSCDPESSSSPPKAWHVSTFVKNLTAFDRPFSIAQSADTLYIVDITRNSLNAIDKNTAQVRTLVSSRDIGGHANGPGTSARFNGPVAVVAVGGSTLYVADSANHRIRKVTIGATFAATQVSDFVGSGTAGYTNGTGATAQLNNPAGIAIRGTTLYVSETGNQRIRTIDTASRTVRDFVGSGTQGYRNGAGANARFNSPGGLAISGDTLYVNDINNHRIRAINIASGVVSDFAGSGTAGHKDGTGAAAQFNKPIGIAASKTTLYIADTGNHRIRAVEIATKKVSTIAGDGTSGSKNGVGTTAQFQAPVGIAVSGNTLYVTTINDSLIRKIEYK